MRRFDLRDLDPRSLDGVTRLNEVLEAVGQGGLVAFPCYAGWRLGTCSQDPASAARIRHLAGYPEDRPLTYLIPSLGILESLFEDEVPRGLEPLGEEVWPGTTTVVVDAAPCVLPQARHGGPRVGLRIPLDPLLRRLMAGLPPIAQARAPAELPGEVDVRLELTSPPPAAPGRVLYLGADGSTELLRGEGEPPTPPR